MIGKTVNSILVGANQIINLVPASRIFPYVMNENTIMPAIIYSIKPFNSEYSKGGWASDDIPFAIRMFSNNYTNLQSIVIAVRNTFEMNKSGSGTQEISACHLIGFEEGYAGGDIFYCELTFKTKINKY